MKNLIKSFSIAFLITTSVVLAQQAPLDSIVISGTFKGSAAYPYITLQGFGTAKNIQRIVTIEREQFRIALPSNTPQGVYRLIYDPMEYKYFDVILNGEKQVQLSYDLSKLTPVLRFQTSDENKAWLAFQETTGEQFTKLSLLGTVLANYPDKNHAFVTAAKKLYEVEKETLLKQRNTFLAQNTANMAGLIAKNTMHHAQVSEPNRPPSGTSVFGAAKLLGRHRYPQRRAVTDSPLSRADNRLFEVLHEFGRKIL